MQDKKAMGKDNSLKLKLKQYISLVASNFYFILMKLLTITI